jgi:RNA polymerase sigma-70 factor (ECF subfamily)
MSNEVLTLGGDPIETEAERPRQADSAARLRDLIDNHYDFTWRSLRRLGVPSNDVDDATQQVFVTFARRLSAIGAGKERSFLFQTAVRVAAENRRMHRRRREIGEEALAGREEMSDPAPAADDAIDLHRARKRLDEILSGMRMELRAVFILFELDELTMAQIAVLLDLPAGTVASRIRRARAHFREAVALGTRAKLSAGGER